VLDGIVNLYKVVVKILGRDVPVLERIEETSKFFPYFKDYIGVIDRSYVPLFVTRDPTL
ncbi:hypothetical protein M438DRAFT_279840, partial [Aureobasidium pullulans EXF-150]